MTPERLVAGVGLDQVGAQLHLLVEELQNGVKAKLLLLVVDDCGLGSCQLAVGLAVAVVVGAAAWVALRGTGGGSLGELGDELLEQELAVVEAAVVGNMHGHPEAHRG